MTTRTSGDIGPHLEVTEVNVYPIKSLGGVSVDSAKVTPKGLALDRNWMVVTSDGKFVT